MYNETKEHRFFCLMRDFIFDEYLISSLKGGKPSRFLFGMSKVLYKTEGRKELLRCAERDFKSTVKDFVEFLKEDGKIKLS